MPPDIDNDMPDNRIAMVYIERTIADRFTKWSNHLKAQQAVPVVCIASGLPGDKRSDPELVLCLPQELKIDWMIQALEDTLVVMRAQQRK